MEIEIFKDIEKQNDKLDPYRVRQILLVMIDILMVIISYLISIKLSDISIDSVIPLGIYVICNELSLYRFNCYNSLWSLGGEREISNIILSGVITLVCTVIVNKVLGFKFSLLFYILNTLIIVMAIISSRVSYRGIRRIMIYMNINKEEMSRVLIVGAGSAGKLTIGELYNNPELKKLPVVIVDDDVKKIGKNILNVPVIGTSSEIKKIVKEYNVDEIIFSIAKND